MMTRDAIALEDAGMGRTGTPVAAFKSDGVLMVIVDYPPAAERGPWQRRVAVWAQDNENRWRPCSSSIARQWTA